MRRFHPFFESLPAKVILTIIIFICRYIHIPLDEMNTSNNIIFFIVYCMNTAKSTNPCLVPLFTLFVS